MRRVGCLFAALLFLSVIGGATLVSLALGRAGLTAGPEPLAILVVGAASVGIMLALFLGAMRRVGRPMGEIVAAADRVARGDFRARVAEHGPPSLRSVAHAFNSMTARLQSQDEQRRHLMADIAHELRTPLAVIQGRLEGLIDGVYSRDDASLEEVLADTRVLARLVEDLRTLANAEAGALTLQKESTDLAILVHDTVRASSAEADARGVTLRVEDSRDLPLIDLDPLRIREVLTNLVSNAIQHTPRGGAVSIAIEPAAGRFIVRVADTGTGVAPEDLPKIFDRFYKGPTSHGSGLGLTIARNLVVAHGGEIRAESHPGKGTTVTFSLPAGEGPGPRR
jgi:signal transduction histidine kinase